MSLSWDISRIKNLEKMKEKHWNLIESLIWESMLIGLNKITESNVKEWWYRSARCCIERGYEPIYTLEQIKLCIGLRTNASVYTASEFDWIIKQRCPERYKRTRKDWSK